MALISLEEQLEKLSEVCAALIEKTMILESQIKNSESNQEKLLESIIYERARGEILSEVIIPNEGIEDFFDEIDERFEFIAEEEYGYVFEEEEEKETLIEKAKE